MTTLVERLLERSRRRNEKSQCIAHPPDLVEAAATITRLEEELAKHQLVGETILSRRDLAALIDRAEAAEAENARLRNLLGQAAEGGRVMAKSPETQTVKLSMCAFQNGTFDLFIIDGNTREEICITGERKFTEVEHDFFLRLMPACVFTSYSRKIT